METMMGAQNVERRGLPPNAYSASGSPFVGISAVAKTRQGTEVRRHPSGI